MESVIPEVIIGKYRQEAAEPVCWVTTIPTPEAPPHRLPGPPVRQDLELAGDSITSPPSLSLTWPYLRPSARPCLLPDVQEKSLLWPHLLAALAPPFIPALAAGLLVLAFPSSVPWFPSCTTGRDRHSPGPGWCLLAWLRCGQ